MVLEKHENRNGVGILVCEKLRDKVREVRRVNNRMILIKLVIEGSDLNNISVCPA